MQITTYLFDLDDTLISTKIYAEIYQPILSMIKTKLNLTDKQLNSKAKSLGLELNKFNRWDTGDLCKKLNLLEEYYQILEQEIEVLPVLHKNVTTILKQLKKDKKTVGIVSNSMTRTINAYLNKYKLNKYFNFTFSKEEVGCKKATEKYWKTLIKKHNLNPKECLVIGDDHKQDIQTPKKLGFNTFLIKSEEDLQKIKM